MSGASFEGLLDANEVLMGQSWLTLTIHSLKLITFDVFGKRKFLIHFNGLRFIYIYYKGL